MIGKTEHKSTADEHAAWVTIVVVGIACRGLVLCKMWQWFVSEPLGAPVIGIATAFGLAMMFSILTSEIRTTLEALNTEPSDKIAWGGLVGYGTVAPILCLLVGLVIHQFQ